MTNWTIISIHALLAESDIIPLLLDCITIPISIHALLAESDRRTNKTEVHKNISIHALLAESDSADLLIWPFVVSISIHALLAESDARNSERIFIFRLFLSTLSLRRATAKVHKTVGHFCAYETNFMGIASSC